MNIFKLFSHLMAVFGFTIMISISAWGDGGTNDSCNGEQISELHAISATTTRNETGTLYDGSGTDDDDDYYYFTPGIAGTLTYSYTSDQITDLRIEANTCNGTRVLDNGTSRSGSLAVGSTDVVYIRIKREQNSATTNYSLDMTFTATVVPQVPPVMNNVPNQVAHIGVAYTLNLATYVTLTNGDPLIAPYYTLTGTLPTGLDFNSTTGVISGTPTVASTVTLSVTATDNDGASNSDSFTLTASVATNSYRDFTLRKQLYAKGNMKTIGNTVMVLPTDGKNCTTYTNGTYNATSTSANGDVNLCAYSVDGTQTNATTAELALPAGAKVIWAGLYWQGIMIDAINPNMQVKIRQNNGFYTTVDVDALNYKDEGWNYTAGNGIHYAAFADVTDLFGEGKWNEGNYTVSDIPVVENGSENGLGTYGAWSLVAIYEDPAEKFRSYSVFDGWKQVTSSIDAVIPISGFYTPNRVLDTTAAKVSVFAAEGDLPYTGDQLKTKNYNTNTVVALETIANNTFNSSVTGGGVRTPNATNNFGIDIQSFDIGNLLTPKQTDMTFTFTSNLDVYWPSMIAVATELVAPQLCYDYSYKQDGAYLKLDNNGTQLPMLTGFVSSSPIDTSIYVRNNEADILAQGVSFYTDVNASMFQYIDNSVYTSNVNGSALIARTDTTGACNYTDSATTPIGCNNGANIRIGLGKDAMGYSQSGAGELGDKSFVYAKFSMDPIGINGITDINQSVGLHLNYYIVPKTGATAIPYDYEFGTDIPLCPPSAGYEPTWGTFNVVESGAATIGGIAVNNLRTKVSRNPFNVNVAAYGKNAVTGKYDILPTSNVNTTLLVEIIDSGAYHDANATCANPDAVISQTIYVPITASTAAPTDPVPLQSAAFHNFAVQNGAFRIWYFDDANQTLIQNWTATTSDATRLNLTSISGLYNSAAHTQCTTECAASTSVACFECIKANYAKPLCSRDNFAVRPESYDLRIYDINQTLAKIDPIKDSTKVALSEQYQYPPTYAAAAGRVNLAAGYDYRYDMNATGHDTDLSSVPGYTRYFNGSNGEYNATMIWEPSSAKTGCNDTSSRALTFYLANGQMSNEEAKESEVGEYRLNITDTSWTEVDWKSSLTGHHLSTNGFEANPVDCIIGTTSTVLSSGKIGCTVSSSADSATPHVNGTQTYKDHLLALQPYKFWIPSAFQYGKIPSNLNIGWTSDGNLQDEDVTLANMVYVSNLSKNADMNMSLQINGVLKAVGYDSGTLSNFVTNCYAKAVNLDLNHTKPAQTRAAYQSRFLDYNSTGVLISDTGAVTLNGTRMHTISEGNFTQDTMGSLTTELRVNYERNASQVLNPMVVNFTEYKVDCPDCNRSADLTTQTAQGNAPMNFDIIHYYGRAQGRDATFYTTSATATSAGGYARINFEVYCGDDAVPNGVACNLPLLSSTVAGENPSWYVNVDHNISNDGISDADNVLSTGNLQVGKTVVPPPGSVVIVPTEVGFERYGVNYNGGNGYPRTVPLWNYADGWLIYDAANANADHNVFDVEFYKKGGWIGEGKSNTATDSDAPVITNRRIMW